MALLLCLVVPLLVLSIFHQPAQAAPDKDMNRVLITYNPDYDSCREIDDFSGAGSKLAADKACEQAFESLDKLKMNSCHGWRQAECRPVEGSPFRRCTCKISRCDQFSIMINVRSDYDDAWQWAEIQRAFSSPGRYGGGSYGAYPSGGAASGGAQTTYSAGPSTAAYNTYDAGTLSGAYTPYDAGTLSGAYTPYDAGTLSGAYDPYDAGTLSGAYDPYDAGTLSGAYTPYDAETLSGAYNPYGADTSGYASYGAGGSRKRSARDSFGDLSVTYPSNIPIPEGHTLDPAEPDTSLHYFCPTCSKAFNLRQDLDAHMKTHTKSAKTTPGRGRRPIIREEEGGRYKCSYCGKSYSLKRVLLLHEKSHITQDTYCVFCRQTFASKLSYTSHMRKRHPNVAAAEAAVSKGGQPTGEPEPGRFACGQCEKSYSSKTALKAHEKSHNFMETYCPFCDRNFGSRNSYREHMGRRHPAIAAFEIEAAAQVREAERKERCKVCGKGFKKARSLKEHMKVHDGRTECDKCGGVFSRISALYSHKKKAHKK